MEYGSRSGRHGLNTPLISVQLPVTVCGEIFYTQHCQWAVTDVCLGGSGDMSSDKRSSKDENNHRAQLPATCIPFSSAEGRDAMKEALKFRHMECFFKLMPQLTTQRNPDCSALACLEMVLNALDIDPGVEWRYPWRWYRQDMLQEDLSSDLRKELTFEQFLFMASLKPLKIVPMRVGDYLNVDKFRNIIKKCTERDDVFVVVRYSRTGMSLNGGDHFSAIGGYHDERDSLLLLDTARFQHPPHWVSLKMLFDAIHGHAVDSGTSGGLVLMSRCMESQSLMFHLAPSLCPLAPVGVRPDVLKALKTWMKFLDQRPETDLTTTAVCFQVINALVDSLIEAENVTVLKACRLDRCYLEELYPGDDCVTCALKESIENTVLFSCVTDVLQSLDNEKYARCEQVFSFPVKHHANIYESECFHPCRCDDIKCSHCLTLLLLAWPYEPPSLNASCFHYQCQKASEMVLFNKGVNEHLTREVAIVRKHLKQLLDLL